MYNKPILAQLYVALWLMVNLYFQFMQAGGLLSLKTLSLTKIKEKDQRVPKQQNRLHLRLVLQEKYEYTY